MVTPITEVIMIIKIFILRWWKVYFINKIRAKMCNTEVWAIHLKQGVLFHNIEVWNIGAWNSNTLFVLQIKRDHIIATEHIEPNCLNVAFLDNQPCTAPINLLAPELFFQILAHPVYKMWIKQEPNMLELWNRLHFEKKKNGEYIPCLKYSVPVFVE